MGSNFSSIFRPYSFFVHSTIYLHFWHSLEPYLFLEPSSFFIVLFSLVSFIPAGHRYASSFDKYLKLYFLNFCFFAFFASNLVSFFHFCTIFEIFGVSLLVFFSLFCISSHCFGFTWDN